MNAPVTIYPGAIGTVAVAGQSVRAVYGGVAGGKIVNPFTAEDQGLAYIEELYVSLDGPADLMQSPTTFVLQAGQAFDLPAGLDTDVWVNAASAGHKFSVMVIQPQTPFPPEPTPGPWPPSGPGALAAVIRSYLYEQYADDADLQAFVSAYNAMMQQYISWFISTDLPVYTKATVFGLLLDWVAAGVYGITRPTLPSGRNRNIGPLNTWGPNQMIPLNALRVIGPQDYAATSDDVFKRIITWNFYKGDGNTFNVRWLKRRVMRFLYGDSGVAIPVSETYRISVTFTPPNQVDITLGNSVAVITGGAILNSFGLNQMALNQMNLQTTTFAPLPNAAIFKAALESGALQLPFQQTYIVNI